MASTTDESRGADSQAAPGAQADSPAQIPAKGWFQITKRSVKEVGEDNLTLIAGGIAYSWFLSLFPMLIAAVSIYGLVVDPAQVQQQSTASPVAFPRRPRV